MQGAVAVDLGATSGRFASGRLENDRIVFQVVEQIPHQSVDRNGRAEWQLDLILPLCQRAAAYATASFDSATLGIDCWGVDHGFLDVSGSLLGEPVAYRDLSHIKAAERLREFRPEIYALTGIQHQPFNTLNQLLARRLEDPTLPERAKWYLLPDLLGILLGGKRQYELTEASTTQLMGLDGNWSKRAFEIIGWPVPEEAPVRPGHVVSALSSKLSLASVGSHDTASAVAGFGRLAEDQMFVNVGTWSLAGVVLSAPVPTPQAEAAGFTNERTVDGRVRFLKNIAGFYVINRLHEELGIDETVPQWLRGARAKTDERIDLVHPDFFNPESMCEACLHHVRYRPETASDWAGLALSSLASTIARQPAEIEQVTGRKITSIRVGGGGSHSVDLCRALAEESGLPVLAGPGEVTVLGNLGMQFLAAGLLSGYDEMFEVVGLSAEVREYLPRG